MRWTRRGEAGGGRRDTKDNGAGATLSFTRSEWAAFLTGVKSEEFEPSK